MSQLNGHPRVYDRPDKELFLPRVLSHLPISKGEADLDEAVFAFVVDMGNILTGLLDCENLSVRGHAVHLLDEIKWIRRNFLRSGMKNRSVGFAVEHMQARMIEIVGFDLDQKSSYDVSYEDVLQDA